MRIRLRIRLLLSLALIAFGMKAYAAPGSYCLALRGNGELAPAHWGGLAQVVERLGLPEGMAGGSSASISLFLLDSIAANPLLQKATPEQKRAYGSLLLKSLQGYLELVASRPEWTEMAAMAQYLKQQAGGESLEFKSWLTMMMQSRPQDLAAIVMQNADKIQGSLGLAVELGVVNPETMAPLLTALQEASKSPSVMARGAAIQKIQFFAGEIYRSITLLGQFNAETDDNLFFRAGVVNFKVLARSFGRVGNFYAGREMSAASLAEVESFLNSCAPKASSKTWDELRAFDPTCDQKFKTLVVGYQKSGLPKSASREADPVGSVIPSFPTTAVLTNNAYFEAMDSLAHYSISFDPAFGKRFSVTSKDVFFGYWGPSSALRKIEANLKTPFKTSDGRVWDFSKDAKSQRFFALGEGSWAQVMSSSPAEPGLAPLQELILGTEPAATKGRVYSAGGWSDLHPGAVLKAAGCDNVVYVTRRGGESLFGQGVAKRLLGFEDIAWEQIATDPARKPASRLRNWKGNPDDLRSEWSRLYNLANPESSFNRALGVFDAVVCTDWDQFDVKAPGAISGMIGDAYRAPWTIRSMASAFAKAVTTTVKIEGGSILTSSDNVVDSKLGYRPYAGCLAF